MNHVVIRRILCASMCAALGAPAVAAAEPRTHDGFYMQLTGGLGYYSAGAEAGGIEQSFSGMTLDTSLMLGGTIIPGLVVGGGFFIDYAPSPSFEQNGMEVELSDVSQMVIGIGPFVDYYLDPKKGGVHIQAFAGWGGLETSSGGNAGGSDPTGLVVSVAGGYDIWLSDEWSVGGMLRVAYGNFSLNDVGYGTLAPALLGTLTWH